MRALLTVTASKNCRICACEVICATCRPIDATSSMSALPSEYHGSSTQSWPNATLTPAAISSGTRVMPRRFGYVSWRPCSVMLMSGLATTCTPASATSGISFET